MSLIAKIENFTENELACSCCGLFDMTDQHLINIQALRYRMKQGLSVTSGCRCKKHNEDPSVGGQPNSRHLVIPKIKRADATDLTCGDLYTLYFVAQTIGLFKEVIWYQESKFVHVATFPEKKNIYYAKIEK